MKNQNNTRYSKQRECILRVLGETDTHPTANYVYEMVRREIPNISLGTVYRNLSKLTEEGAIIKLVSEDTCERYDARVTPHYHITCKSCGAVGDIFIDYDKSLDERAAALYRGEVDGHDIMFFGICDKCKESNDKTTNEKN